MLLSLKALSLIYEGGTLVSIEDPIEQGFIQSHIQIFQDTYSSYWIGLFRSKHGTDPFLLFLCKINNLAIHYIALLK